MVFGDSLSAAYNLSTDEGWVHLIGERIARARLPWRVVNASVTGETTAGGLRRFAEDLKRHKPAIVVIELGANDALRGQPVAGMRSNLEQMIRLARQARAEPVLVGIMIPPNYGIDYAAEFRDMYASVAAPDTSVAPRAVPPRRASRTSRSFSRPTSCIPPRRRKRASRTTYGPRSSRC